MVFKKEVSCYKCFNYVVYLVVCIIITIKEIIKNMN